jgi:transposase
MKRNIENARKLAELRALSFEQVLKMDKETLSDIIFDLNRNKGMSYGEISKITGMPKSTIHHLCNPIVKRDSTQRTHKLIEIGHEIEEEIPDLNKEITLDGENNTTKKIKVQLKNHLDINVLIQYFNGYTPRDNEEKDNMKKLILILMECVKK